MVKAGRTYNTQLAALKAVSGCQSQCRPQAEGRGASHLPQGRLRGQDQRCRSRKPRRSGWRRSTRLNDSSRAAMIRLHREREAVEALADDLDRLTAQGRGGSG